MSQPRGCLGAMRVDDPLCSLAERQAGLVTRHQALTAGMTHGVVDGRVRAERWQRVARDVYRVPGSAPTWRQALLAAVLTAGQGAVASHQSAAALFRVPGIRPRAGGGHPAAGPQQGGSSRHVARDPIPPTRPRHRARWRTGHQPGANRVGSLRHRPREASRTSTGQRLGNEAHHSSPSPRGPGRGGQERPAGIRSPPATARRARRWKGPAGERARAPVRVRASLRRPTVTRPPGRPRFRHRPHRPGGLRVPTRSAGAGGRQPPPPLELA